MGRPSGHHFPGDGPGDGGPWQDADPLDGGYFSSSADLLLPSNEWPDGPVVATGAPPDDGATGPSALPASAAASRSLYLPGTAATLDATVGPDGATGAEVQEALDDAGLSVTGAGVKVGVLSDSFDDLGGAAADEADGALPPTVTVLEDLASGGTDEGRAMLQIVHDVAPGASLYFYTAFESEQDFADGILALAAAGCKVICDDVSYFDEPFFQNGIVAQAIETVEAEGVVYVTAAGNNASDAYQSNWTPIASATVGTGRHAVELTDAENFGTSSNPTPLQTITVGGTSSDTVPLLLEWNEPYGAAASDLEVLVFQQFGSREEFLGGVTNADDDEPTNPWVGVDLTGGTTYQIAIENLSGPDPGLIKEIGAGDGLPIEFHIPVSISGSNVGSVYGHAMTPGVIAVGAVNAADTPAFGVSPPVSESFSSSGEGSELLFSDNGTPLASPDLLDPVTVSGVDNITTTVPGDLADIYGTSAATPTIAATAALMLQEDPGLTPAQISQMIQESALPFGNSAVSGAGLDQIDAAVELAAEAEASVSCFCRGTLIRTDRGDVAIEDLAIGDTVTTSAGEACAIKWIGLRKVVARFADPLKIWPVRVRAGALADHVPARDLLLSPDHAILVDGILIQAGALTNGSSIIRERPVAESFTYFHIELADHSLILAENTPAETFVDNADRMGFDNWAEHQALYGDGAAIREMPYPRAKAWRQVPQAIRRKHAMRAAAIYGSNAAAA